MRRVKSRLPRLMPQSSCSPRYNNTGSTKTGSTEPPQPKSSDALTQKIPSPRQGLAGERQTRTTHTHRRADTHAHTHLRLLREQQTKAVNTAADDRQITARPGSPPAPWLSDQPTDRPVFLQLPETFWASTTTRNLWASTTLRNPLKLCSSLEPSGPS